MTRVEKSLPNVLVCVHALVCAIKPLYIFSSSSGIIQLRPG